MPESRDILRASNLGAPVTLENPRSAAAQAYHEAARRLGGEVREAAANRSLIGRLFGRRAA